VDIENQTLSRVAAGRKPDVVTQLPGGPNGVAIGPDGAAYVANDGGFQFFRLDQALNSIVGLGKLPAAIAEAASQIWVTGDQAAHYSGGSVQRVDLKTGEYSTLYTGFVTGSSASKQAMETNTLKSPDDLVFDSAGGFWFTDWGKQRGRVRDITGIYYALPDGSYCAEIIYPANAPNGIALSPDGKRLYVAETYSQRVVYWDVASPGVISSDPATPNGGHVLASVPGLCDSMKVDEQGNVYVATLTSNGLLANSFLSIISPAGEILENMLIDVTPPDPFPSNLCFGGPDRQTAYITCGGTGTLVQCRMAIPGLAPAF